VAERKYLDADIGIEPEDLTFFRTLSKVYNCPLEMIIDVAVRIGADQLRSGSIRLAPRPEASSVN
jgi:hypothetical protein